ncbi:MAG: RNA methyltransferase [Cyclobacteriaceae bacterium]|nr:RNA methyltransferase [Cyclobacteriaceae bacterium SS2]
MSVNITSPQNPRIKQLISLQKPRERKKTGTFLIEGIREISLAQQGGIEIVEMYLCDDLYQADQDYPIRLTDLSVFNITKDIFSKAAYRDGSGGVLAVAKTPEKTLNQLQEKTSPLYLVIEQVEKPGNIGAVLRTADAAGVDGLIICDPATDLFNPNIIRASLGCLFTVPTAVCTNDELLAFFSQNNIRSYATLPAASNIYSAESYQGAAAILLGAESTGLSDFWVKHADVRVKIPMAGKIDSLNISNAAAIFTFEALRQRNL